ncbi:MAG: hypothetical protein WAT39_15145, partial [Planctomycetota bacterium]
ETAGAAATAGLATVGDLIRAATEGPDLAHALDLAACRGALHTALQAGLAQLATADDWPTLRAQLLGPLTEQQRAWFQQLVGPLQPRPPATPAQVTADTNGADERADRLRAALLQHANRMAARLQGAVAAELAANDGAVMVEQLAVGSVLHTLSHAADDRSFGLRLAAFLFPAELALHRRALLALPPRQLRCLLRELPRLVPNHRLPVPIDTLVAELQRLGIDVPRGVLLHLLRTELRIAIELEERGEVAAADPTSPSARLVELLPVGQPMALTDLVFAWRERWRAGSRAGLLRHLRTSEQFLQIGPESWTLRAGHDQALAAVQPQVDAVVRQLTALGGRHHVANLLALPDGAPTTWLVLDRLRADPRVRLLGRGDACAATHQRSQVMETTLQAMRRAAGDVVTSMFLANQAPEHRRLVARLLQHNRLFVQTGDDRIDTLSNWPFNAERLQRLLALVAETLASRSGYAHASALKTVVDRSDLGGDWLTPGLLADVLRRHGPFEVLPGGIVARADLMLGAS